MTRGKKPRTASQLALIRKVKEARVALESVDIEIEDRVEQLRYTLRNNAEEETRAAIWAALDSGIPIAELKKAMNVANHDTFKKRWISAYVAPIIKTGWEWTLESDGSVLLSYFKGYDLAIRYRLVDGLIQTEGTDLFDAPALQPEIPNHQDDWDEMFTEIKEALNA